MAVATSVPSPPSDTTTDRDVIAAIVDTAPPLTPATAARLAALLGGAS